MVRIHLAIDLNYQVNPPSADFIFNIQAALSPQQTVVWEELQVSQPVPLVMHTDAPTRNRTLRLTAGPGPLQVRYRATLDIRHHVAAPETVFETPVAQLPTDALLYIYPSRYCQSDCVTALANSLFGQMPQGYGRVLAIKDWVQSQVTFQSNTSNSMTSALDTLNDHKGVCRDFAHLMITMCRALNIPARFTTAIDFGADPALGPTDFHAYVFRAHRHRPRRRRRLVCDHLWRRAGAGPGDRDLGPGEPAKRLADAGAPHRSAVHRQRLAHRFLSIPGA
jgi:transglutaminase-like putative cysteine protease